MSGIRFRSVRAKILVACAAVAFSLSAAELMARWMLGAPLPERLPILSVRAHATRGWEMVPGQVHYTYLHKVEVNDLGLRGPELAAKAPGEIRVLALGDSLVYGQGVADEDTIPSAMERMLNAGANGRRFTVVNGGLRAYATNQEIALLREIGPKIAPDIVVLFWYWNDIEDANIERAHARLAPKGEVAFDVGAPLDGWIRFRWHARQLARRSALLNGLHDAFRRAEFPDEAAIRRGLDGLAGHLAQLDAVTRELGCRVLVVVVPDAGELCGRHPAEAISVGAEEVVARSGLPTASVRGALRRLFERNGRLPILPFDGHYDGEANATIAEAVVLELGRACD